jgi:hypothetical protein
MVEYDYIGNRTLVRAMQNGIDLDMRDGSGTYYDGLGRPEYYRHIDTNDATPPVVIGFEYAYDRAGNKTMQDSTHHSVDDQDYYYDSSYRLNEYERPSALSTMVSEHDWSLDGLGNWSSNTTTINGATSRTSSGPTVP